MRPDHHRLRLFITENQTALMKSAKRLALGNDDRAGDYFQQMCVNLIRSNWDPDSAISPLAYARRAMLHVVLNSKRGHAHRELPIGDVYALAAASPVFFVDPTGDEAAAQADWPQFRACLTEALEQLPKDQRIAVILHCGEDLDYDEIADLTGRKIKTVRSDVSRGLTKLRDILGEVRVPQGWDHGD